MDGLWAGAAALVPASGFLAYAVRGRSSSVFGESVWHGDRGKPLIGLTFDDGPSESTPALLDVLAKYNVRATFFMCGSNVRRCTAVAAEVRQRGHEVANHTETHPRFDFKSPEFIYGEMARAQETITGATGAEPRWFRAPYGVRWFGVGAAQRKLKLKGVMWTVIARDWKLNAAGIEQRVLHHTSSGAIVCLHDGRSVTARPDIRPTIEAVERIIPNLQQRGFQFETLSQMLCPTN